MFSLPQCGLALSAVWPHCGFAAFDLDPESRPGDFTNVKVTYDDMVGPDGRLAPFETFTLRRLRRDQA